MFVHKGKTEEPNGSAVSISAGRQQSNCIPGIEFSHNRPEAVAQRKLQEMADSYPAAIVQKQVPEEEELNQDKFESLQRVEKEEKPVQGKFVLQQKHNNDTGLPDNLKSAMEQLSGQSLDHVKVHYNSSKPAAVQAHAYAQGSEIHPASGQNKHLPHELGHVVQQMEGRVQATASVAGLAVNDNPGLETEAARPGDRAMQMQEKEGN